MTTVTIVTDTHTANVLVAYNIILEIRIQG